MQLPLRILTVIAVVLTAGLGSACGERLEPQQVAERFWQAMMAGDAGAARLFVTDASRSAVDPSADIIAIQAYRIGQTIIEDDKASVLTEVVIAADKPVTLPLRTQMVLEEGQWRVDYTSSVATIASGGRLAEMLEKMRQMNEAFSEQVDESLAQLQEAVPKIEQEFQKLEDDINAAMPALKQALQDFARRLEQALGEPGGGKQPTPAPTTPPATQPQQHAI